MKVASQVLKFQTKAARISQLLLQEAFSAHDALNGSRVFIGKENEATAVQLTESHVENISLFRFVDLVAFLNFL